MKLLFQNICQKFLKNCFLATVLTLLFYFLFHDNLSISIRVQGHNIAFFVIWLLLFFYILFDLIRFFFQNKPSKFDFEYFREHIKDYSPSMVSLLMNLKIEQQKDMLADLLYLNHKKYIRIDYETNSCMALTECDLSKPLKILWNLIASHPGIRIEELLSKKSFLVEKDLYKKACYEEAMRIGIIERNIFHSGIFPYIFQWIFLVWISLLFLFLFQESATFFEGLILSFLFTFGISLCVFLPLTVVLVFGKTILFQDTNYVRTKAGKEDVKYWYAYSNFLKDFTNIQDKNLKYNVLYDHTFPYSISLGLNKKIREEFFLERENPI